MLISIHILFEYGILFEVRGTFSLSRGGFDKNVVIFDADVSSSVHVDNRKKYNLIFGKGQTPGLCSTTLTAEAEYSVNFTKQGKKLYTT